MTTANVAAARRWANGYVRWLGPKLRDLLSSELWYEREMLQESLGITEDEQGFKVPFIAGHSLCLKASVNKAAYQLAIRIVDDCITRKVTSPAALGPISSGAITRPKKRGKTGAENGVRDLVFKVMAQELQEQYGLPFGRNDATSSTEQNVAASAIIRDAFRYNDLPVPEDRSIEKAIRRCEDPAC